MSGKTGIAWTEKTWNPVIGCAKVSPGCAHCYAEKRAHRIAATPNKDYLGVMDGKRWKGNAVFLPKRLDQPLRWRKPSMIFVNSMSDIFHEDVSNEQIAAIFGVMAACPQHTFQVLTKRPARMAEWFEWLDEKSAASILNHKRYCLITAGCFVPKLLPSTSYLPLIGPLPNVWLGVSCENQATADERIPLLLKCPAAVRFVSAEPLLGLLDLIPYLGGTTYHCENCGWHRQENGCVPGTARPEHKHCRCIKCDGGLVDIFPPVDWAIVGGESGSGARVCCQEWVRSIVDQCEETGVACFVKQMGSNSRLYDTTRIIYKSSKGADPDEWPEDLRVQQYPEGVTA